MNKARIYKNKTELISDVISGDDVVLDVGFFGQGVPADADNWVHTLIQNRAKKTYGIDLEFNDKLFTQPLYSKQSAEDFNFDDQKFSVIFAGDLIEHLLNPGLFLEKSKEYLVDNGSLVITTPNTFNLFNLAEKITKYDPTVNSDHTIYLNPKTITQMLEKAGWKVERIDYIYSLDVKYKESWKKRVLNLLYKFLSLWTPKYMETMVIIAKK